MSGPRIGDHELARAVRPEAAARTTTFGTRVGAALGSPVGVLIVVPGLVAVVGLFLTLLGQNALRESTAGLGRDRLAEQTSFIARSIAGSLAQGDPLLDRLAELAPTWSPRQPPAPIAHSMRGLMQGRAGVSYVSVSYPDGTFQGAYRAEDGVTRFREFRAGPDQRVSRIHRFEGRDGLALEREESSRYDPRARDFYRLAVASRRRVWTPPYAFFGSNQTGVTRAQALFDPASPGQVQAVLTVDFDVHALSAAMAHPALPGARTLLYTRDGTVLAYPEGASTIARLPARSDHLLSHRDLGDPVIDAFFARLPSPLSPAGVFTEIPVVTGDTALAMAVPVPEFPDLGWAVAAIVPSKVFFRARIQHERQSLVVAAISLVAALAVAVIFSRHVVRVRRDAAAARVVAQQATERARDLGSYRLLERLGQGAMGEVWRAEHRLLARQAAIKLIREGTVAAAHLPPGELRARFRREARTLAALRSRHTIQIYDYGVTEDDTFFFVMELLDGVDLQTLVDRHGPLPAGRVIHLMLQVCSSLAEAHDAGLVHRDIKPANLFVCRAADEVDVIKVLDFGLVQAARESGPRPDIQRILAASAAGASATVDDPRLTRAGEHLGTPAYMAPEQVRGEHIDGRADLYALACVAVWLLAGRTLFKGPTAIATMAAQLLTPVPDLAALVPGTLPPALDRILRQCLAKAPAERPPHAHALATALRSIELPAGAAWTPAQARAWWADRFR